jgi:hypothetical protein
MQEYEQLIAEELPVRLQTGCVPSSGDEAE